MMKLFHAHEIPQAAELMLQGIPVAFPTETVYGMGAPFSDQKAVNRIFTLKGRPLDNPLICHIAQLDDLYLLAREVPDEALLLANHFWPGPLTLVLKRKEIVPDCVTGGLDTVAIRMPSHPLALELIQQVKAPIVGPSANQSGRPSSTSAQHVIHDFQGKECGVIDGGVTEEGLESTVVFLADTPPLILRQGAITQEMLEKVLGCEVKSAKGDTLKASPGTRYRHYAPRAQVTIKRDFHDVHLLPNKKYFLASTLAKEGYHHLKPSNLYQLLRKSDEELCDEVVIVCLDKEWNNLALRDRLLKASGHSSLSSY
ncbi:L-threonylcarbamoyladenylate synthase [Rhabdochlamydiaceae symbiont of Dictyostelium giganteum]|uniref:L-threonylcarbamoyladenylate synthase n=1 Tax=Rhabdochlamydiaceae symbiont of Dictyostelium giganteum TaxID=3342349 RepID=UPI00384AFBB3